MINHPSFLPLKKHALCLMKPLGGPLQLWGPFSGCRADQGSIGVSLT